MAPAKVIRLSIPNVNTIIDNNNNVVTINDKPITVLVYHPRITPTFIAGYGLPVKNNNSGTVLSKRSVEQVYDRDDLEDIEGLAEAAFYPVKKKSNPSELDEAIYAKAGIVSFHPMVAEYDTEVKLELLEINTLLYTGKISEANHRFNALHINGDLKDHLRRLDVYPPEFGSDIVATQKAIFALVDGVVNKYLSDKEMKDYYRPILKFIAAEKKNK